MHFYLNVSLLFFEIFLLSVFILLMNMKIHNKINAWIEPICYH